MDISLLNKCPDWFGDGTFDIVPILFQQLYSIHASIDNKYIPLVYAFLPNKKQTNYDKLLNFISQNVTVKLLEFLEMNFQIFTLEHYYKGQLFRIHLKIFKSSSLFAYKDVMEGFVEFSKH